MNKQEKIVCPAIMVYVTKEDYNGSNVICGTSYKDINDSGVLDYIGHPTHQNIWVMGFKTNRGRFVKAEEAYYIALDAFQLTLEQQDNILKDERRYLLPEDME